MDTNDNSDIIKCLKTIPLKLSGLNQSVNKQVTIKNNAASKSARPTIEITGSV